MCIYIYTYTSLKMFFDSVTQAGAQWPDLGSLQPLFLLPQPPE